MTKRTRQYLGILSAILAYYLIHEGAHLLYALSTGVFRQIRFMGLGMQIDIFPERMTDLQMGLFCLAGSVSTAVTGWILTGLADRIVQIPSKLFKACMYYITIAMLFIDPLYLSLLCGFFGGGDMNGIALLIPETTARAVYGILFAVNLAVFRTILLPKYRAAFADQ
jgi:hypothetical protein